MTIVRSLKNQDNMFILIDTKGNISEPLTKNNIKNEIWGRRISPVDFQMSQDDRLIIKRVEYKDLCRKYDDKPLSTNEQEMILFYGLAKINQLPVRRIKQILDYIDSLHNTNGEILTSLFTDNINWNFKRYSKYDTVCKDNIINIMYVVAGSKNGYYHI